MRPSSSETPAASQAGRARCAALAGALLLAVCASRAAAAPAPAPGDDLIERGVALRRQGKDAAALPFFQEAHQRAHTARSAALLGFAEQALGQWVPAELHLSHAIATTGDPWIRANAPLIEESLRFVQRHLGSIEVDVSVPGADVSLDAIPVGRTPLPAPLRAPAGDRWIEMRAAGYRPHLSVVAVQAGKTARVAAQLEATAPPRAIPPAPAPALGIAARADGASASAAAGRRPIYETWWFWTGMAVVLAGVGVAIAAASGSSAPYPCGGSGRVCAE